MEWGPRRPWRCPQALEPTAGASQGTNDMQGWEGAVQGAEVI